MHNSDPSRRSVLLNRVQNAIRGLKRSTSKPREAVSRDSGEEKTYQRRKPASLCAIERRPLTPSSASTTASTAEPHIECHDQQQSPLFQRLPPEIRRMIYEHALGKNILHILLQTGKLSHICCYEPGKKDWWRHTCLGPAWEEDGTFAGRTRDGSGIADGDKLPLLQTCRRIYSEAIEFMYSANTFDIQDLDRLFDLARTTLPQRMQTIGALQLRYFHSSVNQDKANNFGPWEKAIGIIASMRSLKRLRIEVSTEKMYPTLPRVPVYLKERELLQPLTALGFVKDFEVEVNWLAREDAIDEEGLPFKLQRPIGNIQYTSAGLYGL